MVTTTEKKLLKAQATDRVGVTLRVGTLVREVAPGEYADRGGRLCWPPPADLAPAERRPGAKDRRAST